MRSLHPPTFVSVCRTLPMSQFHMVGLSLSLSLAPLSYGALHSGLLNRLCCHWHSPEWIKERGVGDVTETVTATEWWQTLNMTHKWFKTNFNATAGSPAPRLAPSLCFSLAPSSGIYYIPICLCVCETTLPHIHAHTHVAKLGCWRIKVSLAKQKEEKTHISFSVFNLFYMPSEGYYKLLHLFG